MKQPKQWWAPVWAGLVMDRQARHYQRMKNALWLFLYLLLGADRRTGRLKRKVASISSDMAISRDTVLRWLNSLRNGGYITTRSTGRCLDIEITHWKPLSPTTNFRLQQGQTPHTSREMGPTSLKVENPRKTPPAKQESAQPAQPIERSITRAFLSIDIDKKYLGGRSRSNSRFFPRTREQLLAQDLSEGLNDPNGFPLYLSYAKRYPESELRSIMTAVKEIPPKQIKKSRGALFNHLVQQTYAKQSKDHSGR